MSSPFLAGPFPQVDSKVFASQPIERAETLPAGWYTDPAFHEIDRELLFARTWQYAAHRSQLERPGSYVTAEVAGNPIILVRGKDDVVRAFYNVCRHRGGPLAMDGAGCVNVLQCKYHGWTYLLDGSLRGVPKFDRTELFDRRDYGLVPVALREWQGLYFVCLTDAPEPLETVLDGIAERIAPLSPSNVSFHSRVVYDVACNWKVYVDNYLEGYHIPLVHPELMGMLNYRGYATETQPWYSLQHSPLRHDNARYGGEGTAYYYFVFPNLMLNVLPGRLQSNVVIPLAPGRTRILFDYFYDDVSSTESVTRIEEDLAFSDRVQREDGEICEYVQRGLSSRAYNTGRYSPEMEEGVYHFHSLLRRAYAHLAEEGQTASLL